MSVAGLSWNTWTMRFTAGLNQKADPRSLEPPELTILKDAQFDEIGGLQTRYPYAALGSNIYGGGTISNARRLVANGNELLLFTKDTLYSWSAQQSKWRSKGTHLAVKVEETPRFIRTTEQIECDRAELDDVIVYSWSENGHVFWGAEDKNDRTVLVPPQDLGEASRTRVVALDTKILLFYFSTLNTDLIVFAIDPANLSDTLGAGATVVSSTDFNGYYDVVKVPGADTAAFVARRTPTTSYEVGKVTSALVVTTSTKARTCTGAIALSVAPDGKIQVVRDVGGNALKGDLLSSALVDVFTDQAIGTYASDANQIACAHRSVTDSGYYRCYVFWSSNEQDRPTAGTEVKYNWANTNNTLSAEATFLKNHAVASRAFDHDGRVYVNCVFAGLSEALPAVTYNQRAALQNTYFLLRDDEFLVAKSIVNTAGGYQSSASFLPGVALTEGSTGYSWCGTERRSIQLGGLASGYADRGPRDVTYTFDSNEARRCARLGSTLYIACGEGALQYDGVQLTEVSFHCFPYFFEATEGLLSGLIEDGTYSYKVTPRWDNGVGEIDRGTTATTGVITIGGGTPSNTTLGDLSPIHTTHKTSSAIAIEVWRTLANPTDDSPYFLVTSKDSSDTTGANCYVANDTSLGDLADFVDELADEDLQSNETNPENGGTLENLAPPPATIVLAGADRLLLAGIAGSPYTIRYSKLRGAGEVAAFHEALSVDVPPTGGPIQALAFLNETLIALCDTAIWALPGDGFDNLGGGTNYGPARLLSTDIGVTDHDSVVVTDKGVIFKSRKGWYMLNRGWALDYIGGGVSDYDSETVLAASVVESQHQIRFLTSSRLLVFDTLVSQWDEDTISSGLHACIWNGAHAYLTSTGPYTQGTSYTSVDYGIDLETAWIKLSDLQGYGAIDMLQLLGEFRSDCTIRVRLARDYWKDGDGVYFQDKTHTPSSTAGMPLELQHSPSIRQVKALKVRITVTPTAAGESVKLTGIAFKLGIQPGLNRNIPSASKQ